MIRKMNKNDSYDVVNLAQSMHDESGFAKLTFSPEKCYNLFHLWLLSENFFMICDEKNEEIRGAFLACLVPYPYGTDSISQDIMFYVKPKHRGKSIAYRLVKAYEKWAKESGAKRICLAHSCEINDNKLDKMFKRLGFEYYSSSFKKGI